MSGGAAPALIVVLGPTASGKTDVSVSLAEALGAEIVCADSRQLYAGLDIGTGKPSASQRARVPHHLIDTLDPSEAANAAAYARAARAAIAQIRERGMRAIVTGGSGLYVRALLDGIFDGPGRNAQLRTEIAERAARMGWAALHAEVAERDPESAARIHPNDAVRITRALEIMKMTGLSASEARRRGAMPPIELGYRAFAIDWPRGALDERIRARFSAMLDAGLVAEVRALLARGVAADAPAFDAPGYREIVAHLAGEMTLERAAELAIIATRQYAKRQMTWFRRVAALEWISAQPTSEETARRVLDALAASDGAKA
ncbi:MAG: tRNA (adenosine(37)-N6)-dimethylallyltransferase MiaA [bacterium]